MQKKAQDKSRYLANYLIDQYPYIIVMIQVYNRRYFAGKSKNYQNNILIASKFDIMAAIISIINHISNTEC